MEHSRASEANSFSAFQEFATCVYAGTEDQIHVLATYFFKTQFNVILLSIT
jgi:uncharacterized protein (DUF952 family)